MHFRVLNISFLTTTNMISLTLQGRKMSDIHVLRYLDV